MPLLWSSVSSRIKSILVLHNFWLKTYIFSIIPKITKTGDRQRLEPGLFMANTTNLSCRAGLVDEPRWSETFLDRLSNRRLSSNVWRQGARKGSLLFVMQTKSKDVKCRMYIYVIDVGMFRHSISACL